MHPALQVATGLGLTIVGWLLPRLVANAPPRWHPGFLVDLAVPNVIWAALVACTAQPIFAGMVVLCVFGGFALADWGKRRALLEPVVFSDMSELVEVFRHPRLYIPFAGNLRVAAAGAVAAAALLASLVLIPPAWPWTPWPMTMVIGCVAALTWVATRPPLLDWIAGAMTRLHPLGVPLQDAATLGPLTILLVYGSIARAERSSRQSVVAAPNLSTRTTSHGRPLVMVQSESFFDARRMHPAMPRDLLPMFDACCRTGAMSGHLSVGTWGANTTRSEFAALTGVSPDALGYDRFNPYHAFALMPIRSLAWCLRDMGYHTVCLHPFDRTFYKRDRVMKNLGFDSFLGEEAFVGAARSGLYVSDVEVARVASTMLREAGAGIFVFVITMENHGPWFESDLSDVSDALPAGLPSSSQAGPLRSYLAKLKRADAMLAILTDALAAATLPGALAFYGDHQPTLSKAFSSWPFDDLRTDYVIWNAGGGTGLRQDLQAHELPAAILKLTMDHDGWRG